MARAKVILNRSGMHELLTSPQVAAELEERAGRVLSAAQASAPVVSGAYRDSLRVEVVQHPSRVVARVVAGVGYGMAVEARHGVLVRALGQAGV